MKGGRNVYLTWRYRYISLAAVYFRRFTHLSFFFLCRHYKLEAEIASMTWKVHWEDVIVMASRKTRGSMYSLTGNKRRGSQLVNIALPLVSIVVLTWAFEISHFHLWVWKILLIKFFFSKLNSMGHFVKKLDQRGLSKKFFIFNFTVMNLIFMHRESIYFYTTRIRE